MNDVQYSSLHEEELAFFGKVGASVSHEMRNVLSIVGEYAGLLADLVAVAENGRPPDYTKFKELSANIIRQVRKGTEAMERFSRFAHTTDERRASCDLTVLTADMAALAQRYVTLAGCRLEVQLPDAATPLNTCAFALQRAIHSAIGLLLEFLQKGELVTLKLVAEGPTAVISVSGKAAAASELSARIPPLCAVMKELKGSADASCKAGVLCLALTVPRQ